MPDKSVTVKEYWTPSTHSPGVNDGSFAQDRERIPLQ